MSLQHNKFLLYSNVCYSEKIGPVMQKGHSHFRPRLLGSMAGVARSLRACVCASCALIGAETAMRRAQSWVRWAAAAALPLLVGACAAVPRDASLPVNDPNENVNRHIMTANQEILRPAAVAVTALTPGPIHDRVRDFNSNLKEPRILINDVLQGRFEAATHTTARLAMNTVFGVGGLFDIATREGLPQESGDFGQTLFVWGVAEGPYTVRPWFGPSTLRDAVGSTVDMFTNPVGLLTGSSVVLSVGTSGLDAVDKLGQLKQAEDASIDFYSFVRSSYYQTRRAELRAALGQPAMVNSPALTPDDPDAGPTQTAAPATPPAKKVAHTAPPSKKKSRPAVSIAANRSPKS